MIWYLIFGGILSFMLTGILSAVFSGRLAARLMMWSTATSGAMFALAALLLMLLPPWKVEYVDPSHAGRHAWVGVIINAIFVMGPQLTGLMVGGIAFYILRGARDMRFLIERGYYDKA